MDFNNKVIIQWVSKIMPANNTKVTGTWPISLTTKVKGWCGRQKANNNDKASTTLDVISCYVGITNYILYHTTANTSALTDSIFCIGY